MTEGETTHSYPLSPRNRVKRLHDRGFYDHATVHSLLDASMLCHVSYVIDGQPYCTPTFFWREETRLYWHGSSASRMLRNQSERPEGLSHRRASRQPGAGEVRIQSFGGLPGGDGLRHRLPCHRSGRKAARAGRHGRPVLSRSYRRPATKHDAGDQGDLRHRDGDRGGVRQDSLERCRRRRGGLRIADLRRAHSGTHRARRAGTLPAASRRRRAAGVAAADIRKAVCSKKPCEMPIFCNTPAAEIGLGCPLS